MTTFPPYLPQARSLETPVNEALRRLAVNAAPTRARTLAGISHRIEIEKKLVSAFGTARLIPTGSNRGATAVRGYSDEDFFAVLDRSVLLRDSRDVLSAVATALRERFPRTEIRVSRPSVRVPFDDGEETIEIPPVGPDGRTFLGFSQFQIPDGNGGWMFSAPESHNGFVSEIDRRHNGAVRLLTVLAKVWKYVTGAPIRSFYIEITVAAYASTLPKIDLARDLAGWAAQLVQLGLPSIFDPRFPYDGFVIWPCATDAQRQDALSRLTTFADRAARATALANRLEMDGAIDGWALALGGRGNEALPR